MKFPSMEFIMALARLFKSKDFGRDVARNYLYFYVETAKDFGLYYYMSKGKFYCESMVRGEDSAWRYASRTNFW